MKLLYFTYKSIHLVLISMLIALVGCSKEPIAPVSDNVIVFGRAPLTSAGTETSNAILWGYYEANSSTQWVFEGVGAYLSLENGGSLVPEVTKYWTANTYNFYSIWPQIDGASVSDGGKVEIPDFDISTQSDLCLAIAEGEDGSEKMNSGDPVELKYQHLLSKVYFKGKSNNASVRANLKSVKLTIPKNATYSTDGGWSNFGGTTDLQSNAGWTLNYGSATDIIPNGWLVFPQSVAASTISFTISYLSNDGSVTEKIGHIPVTNWVAGKTYNYNFSVDAAGFIIFDEPTITTWGEASAGPTIVF